jgi:hypothetical protein
MKSPVEVAEISVIGDARKARAIRSPLRCPQARTNRAMPTTVRAPAAAVARLTSTWPPTGSSTAVMDSNTGTPGGRDGM